MGSQPPLHIKVRNTTAHVDHLFAYVTGLDQSGRRWFLRDNGHDLYYPASPGATNSPIGADVSIEVGRPGHEKDISVPIYFAGARVYFGLDDRITFRLNPGPALVEPSATDPGDPNIHKRWDFCELSFNPAQVFANITYVDFVSVPIALTLYTNDGHHPQHVSGMNEHGLHHVAERLREQHQRDGVAWNRLIVHNRHGDPLRILSPNSAISTNGALFAGYYHHYIERVWQHYGQQNLTINTQAAPGNVTGRVEGNNLIIAGQVFVRPLTRDVFSNSTGPFITYAGNETRNAIVPRLAAAFNRTVLLLDNTTPDGDRVGEFYNHNPTNHYAKIVHNANLDKKGYAFPYDDVTRSGGGGVAGTVQGPPRALIIAVGGTAASKHPAPLEHHHHHHHHNHHHHDHHDHNHHDHHDHDHKHHNHDNHN